MTCSPGSRVKGQGSSKVPSSRVLGSLVLLLLATGCATSTSQAPVRRTDVPAGQAEGRVYKVTYYRFMQMPKGIGAKERNEELQPHYFVMLSRGWVQKHGKSAGEPFERTVQYPSKAENLADEVLERLVADIVAKGWDELPEFDLARLTAGQLFAAERNAKARASAGDPTEAALMRYITIETPSSKKTVCRRDVILMGEAISRKFVECEQAVMRVAMQHTIQVSVGSSPIIPK